MNYPALIVLGKSEAAITMICDNLESHGDFRDLLIINNLGKHDGLPYRNARFKYAEHVTLPGSSNYGKQFILGTLNCAAKITVFETFNIASENFVNVIHKSAQLSSTSVLGQGAIINSLVSVAAHTRIGNFVTINRNASVGHHAIIEDFATIGPGAVVCGNTKIGAGTSIGAGAIIIDGITIGKNCLIGAGAVVVKDVPDNSKGFGNPFTLK